MTTHTIDVYVTVTHKYIATVDSEASLEEVKHAIRGIRNASITNEGYYLAQAIDEAISDNYGDLTHVREYDTEVEQVYIEGDKQ